MPLSMQIAIFSKQDDAVLNYLLQCFAERDVSIGLIINQSVITKPGRFRLFTNKIFRHKNCGNAFIEGRYTVKTAGDHNSTRVRDWLLGAEVDYVFLSKAGIIKKNILEGPWRIINVHPAVLPRYRGIGSCEWAIYENGPLGVSAHYIDQGIDTGPIIQIAFTEPHHQESLRAFRRRLDRMRADIMADLAKKLHDGDTLPSVIQPPDSGVLYTRKPDRYERSFIEAAYEMRKHKGRGWN